MPSNQAVISLATQDGQIFTCWDSVKLQDSFTDPLGSYKFTATPRTSDWPAMCQKLRKGELVAIKVDNRPFATPLIVSADKVLGSGGVSLEVECKSVLCTPYEGYSNPDMAKKWKEDVAVDTVLLDQLALYGLSEIYTDSTAHANALTGKPLDGRAAPVDLKALTLKELQGQESETAYQLCSRVFLRLGCALHVDWQGALTVMRPDYEQASAYSLVQDSDFSHPGDRILLDPPARLHDSNEGMFSEVVVRGQAPDDNNAKVAAQPIARVGVSDANRPAGAPYGKVALSPLKYTTHKYESTHAPYKPKIVQDKDSRDAKVCRVVARAAYGNRLKDAFWFTCSVSGFVSTTGRVWTPNTIANVFVEAWGFEERMWIMERTLEQSKDVRRTDLKLIARGGLTIGGDES